jgi:hypothetical protein
MEEVMRFRVHGGNLHVHQCPEHPRGCDYFLDHTLSWMLGNRNSATAQLLVYRRSVVARIASLSVVLASIDAMLTRIREIGTA